MDPLRLTDDDITVRPWQVGDIDDCQRACQDPDIRRWTMVPSPYRREHAEQFITKAAPLMWSTGSAAPLAVADTATDRLLGSAGLVTVDPAAGTAELGYWTAPWARGRSLAERASRIVARWAFATLGIRRLGWQAEVGNHVSRLVALRLGIRQEGTLRAAVAARGGGTIDAWHGALLAGELTTGAVDLDGPTLRRASRQARTFGADRPTLPAGEFTLRPLVDTDLDDLVRANDDADMIAFTTVPDPYRASDADYFIRYGDQAWRAGTAAVFAIDDGGRLAGTIDLTLDPWPGRIANVGYSVAPWARGRGAATSALRALADWGFDALDLDRIEWRAFTGNVASRRVAEKAGVVVEGTERGRLIHRGRPADTWYGALLRTDR